MPSFKINNRNRNIKKIQSVSNSQRNSCSVVFYRYDETDIVKPVSSNISNTQLLNKNKDSAAGNLKTKANRLVIDNDVVRINIDKNKGNPSGSFSITLRRGRVERGEVRPSGENVDYLSAISPGDWVMIYIKKSGSVNVESTRPDSGLKCIGIVENVRYVELDDKASGRPLLQYIITGRDFGKVFDLNIFFNPVVNSQAMQTLLGTTVMGEANKAVTPSATDAKGIVGANKVFSPDVMLNTAIDFYLGGGLAATNRTNQNWYIPKELASKVLAKEFKTQGPSFSGILKKQLGIQKYNSQSPTAQPQLNSMLGEIVIMALPSEGSAWNTLKYLSNAAINELYTELKTIDGRLYPTIVCRQFPFSGTDDTSVFKKILKYKSGDGSEAKALSTQEQTYMKELPRHTIQSTAIKQKNIGKSDFERINHIFMKPRILNNSTINELYASIINLPSVQRHGLKSLQTQTAYVVGKEDATKTIEKFLHLIMDWFFLAHEMYNGTMIVDGFDSNIEIGNNLYISDIEQLFHIEGYTHTYEQDAGTGKINYETTLRVSRGVILRNGSRLEFISRRANNKSISIVSAGLENIRNNNRGSR